MSANPTIDFIESSLHEVLDREEKRLTTRTKLLRRVYNAVSDGATLELSSTQTTDVFLVGSLDKYFGG